MSWRPRNTVPTPAVRVDSPRGGSVVPRAAPVLLFDRTTGTQYLVNAQQLSAIVQAEQQRRAPRRRQYKRVQRGA